MVKRKIQEVDDFLHTYEYLKDRVGRMCYVQGCRKQSRGFGSPIKGSLGYGFKGGDRVSCKKHKLPEHVEQNHQCIYVGCELRGKQSLANYNFCAKHVDQVRKDGDFPEDYVTREKAVKCRTPGCEVAASYDGGKHCKQHAVSNKSDDRRRCEFEGCRSTQRPTFGIPGEKPTRCKNHKTPDMASHKQCVEEGCKVSASYGLPDEVAQYCKTHAGVGYILNTKTCVHDGCDRQPSFGNKTSSESTYCSKHKPDDFVDVKNKTCVYEGCPKKRSFGLKDGERLWCYDHKTEDCINLVETKCAMACCMYGEGIQGKYFHPDYKNKGSGFFKKRICSFARRALIEDALMADKKSTVETLLKHFGLNEVETLNAQSAVRVECEKHYHKLLSDCNDIIFDHFVFEGCKGVGNKRPDIFYKWVVNGQGFAIHIEYDEDSDHEDDTPRLKRIAKEAGCEGRTYVIRVQGGRNTKNPLCKVVREEYYKYWKVTDAGKEVCRDVADLVKQRIGWIKQGLAPDSNRPAKYVV